MRTGLGLALTQPRPASTTPDATPPALVGATVAADGTTLTTVWSEAVTYQNLSVGIEGNVEGALNYVSGNGTTSLTFVTDDAVVASSDSEVLFASVGAFEDAAGNGTAIIDQFPVTNNSTRTRPLVSSATVLANGTTLRVVFNVAVTGPSSGADGYFLTGLSGGSATLAYSTGGGTATVDFTISRTVTSAETGGLLAYSFGDTAAVSGGVRLANFSGQAVTNNSTQTSGPAIRATSSGSLSMMSNGTTPTLPTHQAGDFLVVWIGGTQVDATGWTRTSYFDQYSEEIIVSRYTKVASSSSDTLVLGSSVTAPYQGYSVSGYTGTDGSGVSRGNGTTITAPTFTTLGTNRIWLTCFAQYGAVTLGAPSAGTALAQTQAGNSTIRTAYEARPTQGETGTRTASSGSGSEWVGAGIAVY